MFFLESEKSVREQMLFPSKKAFTLTELMLSLGFGLLLIAGAIFFARSMSRKISDSQKSLRLISTKDRIFQSVMEDLNHAIYFDGESTKETMSYGGGLIHGARGLSRWPDQPRANPEDSDELIIVAEKFSGLSQPVHVQVSNLLFTSTGESSLDDFVSQSFQRFQLFSLTRTNARELVEKESFISDTEISVKNGDQVLADLQTEDANLTPIELVRYRIQEDNLVRETYSDFEELSGAPISSKVIARDVSKFQVDYGFRDRSRSLVLPDHRLSHPEEFQFPFCSGGNCCDPSTQNCPAFSDVFDLQVSLDLFYEASEEMEFSEQSGFHLEGDHVVYSTARVIIPGQLGILTADTDLSGQSGCNPNDIFTRCTADCDGAFTSSDRNSPRWQGYKTGSPYCVCGTNGDEFTPPEVNRQGMPAWQTRGTNTRINACLAAFNPCSTSWLRSIHPGAWLACSCLQPRSDVVNQQDDGTYSLLFNEDNLQSGLLDQLANPASENNMFCRDFRSCDDKIALYLGAGNLPIQNPWEQRCGCLTHNIDENGQVQADQEIYSHARRWNKLCNLTAIDPNDGNSPTCSNTIEADSDVYRMKLFEENLNPQGLKPDDAMFCECLRQNNAGGRYNGVSNNSDFDLRVPNPDGASEIVNSPERANKGTFGSQDSLVIDQFTALVPTDTNGDGQVDSFSTADLSGGSCDENYCRNIRVGLGCTTSTHPSSNNLIGFIRSQLAPRFRDYANYCTDQAVTSLRVNPGNRNEIQRVREIITGTAAEGRLPDWCGGDGSEGSAL